MPCSLTPVNSSSGLLEYLLTVNIGLLSLFSTACFSIFKEHFQSNMEFIAKVFEANLKTRVYILKAETELNLNMRDSREPFLAMNQVQDREARPAVSE